MSLANGLIFAAVVVLAMGLLYLALPWVIRHLLRLMLWPRYRLVESGLENLPRTGAAVLALNHVTWIDGFIIAAACPRRGRALINATYIGLPVLRQIAARAGLIPVPFTGPRALRASIVATRHALDCGEVVAIFPEAQLARTGFLGPFYRGIEVIVEGRDHIPVIPVYLDNLWGSIFSYSEERFFWKWPRGWRRTIRVVYGPPVPRPITAFGVRQALLATSVRAVEDRLGRPEILETFDPKLPRFEHPTLGPLTASAEDFHEGDVRELGHKEGSVGHPLPGVALKILDKDGVELPPTKTGQIFALVAGRGGWADTGCQGSLDRDGFLTLVEEMRASALTQEPGSPSSGAN